MKTIESTEQLYKYFKKTTGVCTDTRKISPGNLFFALKGPNFDANRFAAVALEKGARYAMVDDPKYAVGEQFLVVKDGLKALQELANYHRRQLDIPVIGITGSNGKTTTKELLKAVLSKKYKTFATVGNFNNHIGVPLTLLAIDSTVEMAIIEMGANKIGDISELCDIAEPTFGLITNIGKAHTEGFGGYEGVIRGKSELYHYLIQRENTIFVNSRQEVLRNMAKRMKNPIFYPNQDDYYHCKFLEASPFVIYQDEEGNEIKTHLIGQYNFDNITTALCVGKYFNISTQDCNEAIEAYVPDNMRSQLISREGNTIILDAYNANPSSMQAALENFKAMKAKHKVVILGDMNELGEISEEEHRKIGRTLYAGKFDQVYLCGTKIQKAIEECPQARWFKDREQLSEALQKEEFVDSLILVKGSRGIGLESMVELI
ncbi:UDP-N-acetylmuramoyl-tripeptide--D-alanyl-D-alanine ligase [Xanthovirga aplysinae]|uniref:UDP-N-acetylmuramoyl-tripeptide--D-alanyl-D- alanine ligase n=1 Tax=Xanthovirga aplysinae TaxID=2529853 RepID=UPI0012BCBC42|nr:UDP-N-acetylmuramoyl-tripeptide--D-alanyl-D-alanine ligase [Xanthovirga aplysinae]MTI31641.1 UDP-N-acetylmuramoyl-tripeptide--D-alanyl-D-alanine ligase [Xanthovirga aplysinae]